MDLNLELFIVPEYIKELLKERFKYAKVDKLSLDTAWEEITYVFLSYSDALADMEMRIGKRASDLDLNIRVSERGKTKRNNGEVSESKVKSGIERDKLYIEMQYIISLLKNAVDMLRIRKSQLEKICDLYHSGYYIIPKDDLEKRRKLRDQVGGLYV